MPPLAVAEDRGIAVPMGKTIRTGYVPIFAVELACRDRMAIGDVERAMQRRMASAPGQPWPCPVGEWNAERDRFVIYDGRHEYVAALMLGVEHLLVAWVEDEPAKTRRRR
jgi:hypothetical protein